MTLGAVLLEDDLAFRKVAAALGDGVDIHRRLSVDRRSASGRRARRPFAARRQSRHRHVGPASAVDRARDRPRGCGLFPGRRAERVVHCGRLKNAAIGRAAGRRSRRIPMLDNRRADPRRLALADRFKQIAAQFRAALGSDRIENRGNRCIIHSDRDELPRSGDAGRIRLACVGQFREERLFDLAGRCRELVGDLPSLAERDYCGPTAGAEPPEQLRQMWRSSRAESFGGLASASRRRTRSRIASDTAGLPPAMASSSGATLVFAPIFRR